MLGRITDKTELFLPIYGVLSNGQTVSNYNQLSTEILIAEGWKEIEEIKPAYDEDTQYLEVDTSVDMGDKIIVTYKVVSNIMQQVVVDITKFGIVHGDFGHKPPYSQEEYLIAYNNMEGFKKALIYYGDLGISTIIFPKKFYPVCYRNPTGAVFSLNTGWEIAIPTNTTLDLGGSIIKVIFDSDNKNPYDLSAFNPYALNGCIFEFRNAYYSYIKNGEIIGDRYDRSYVAGEAEAWMEQTVAIRIKKGSSFCKIEDMKIHGFMGDSISGHSTTNDNENYFYRLGTLYPGYVSYKDNGLYKTDLSGAYTTNLITVNINMVSFIINTGGYDRIPNFAEQSFSIHYYDANDTYILSELSQHMQSNTKPYNATKIRITIYGEEAGLVSIDKSTFIYIQPEIPVNNEIVNCKIYNNNRGGISNIGDVTIRKCEIYECGQGVKMGWLVFPDPTRYLISIEDNISRSLVIDDCYLHDSFNCILTQTKSVTIKNCRFKNIYMETAGMYFTDNLQYINNNAINCRGFVFVISDVEKNKYRRTLVCRGNYLKSFYDAYDVNYTPTDNLLVINEDNIIEAIALRTNGCKNNKFKSLQNIFAEGSIGSTNGIIQDFEQTFTHAYRNGTKISYNMDVASGGNTFNLNDFKVNLPYNLLNSTINNGLLYVVDIGTYKIDNCELKMNEMQYSSIISWLDDVKTLTISNCKIFDDNIISNVSKRLFFINKNHANETFKTDMVLNISDCEIILSNPNVDNLFYVNFATNLGVGVQTITINLTNVVIKNNTGNTVRLLYSVINPVTTIINQVNVTSTGGTVNLGT